MMIGDIWATDDDMLVVWTGDRWAHTDGRDYVGGILYPVVYLPRLGVFVPERRLVVDSIESSEP